MWVQTVALIGALIGMGMLVAVARDVTQDRNAWRSCAADLRDVLRVLEGAELVASARPEIAVSLPIPPGRPMLVGTARVVGDWSMRQARALAVYNALCEPEDER